MATLKRPVKPRALMSLQDLWVFRVSRQTDNKHYLPSTGLSPYNQQQIWCLVIYVKMLNVSQAKNRINELFGFCC